MLIQRLSISNRSAKAIYSEKALDELIHAQSEIGSVPKAVFGIAAQSSNDLRMITIAVGNFVQGPDTRLVKPEQVHLLCIFFAKLGERSFCSS